MPALLPKSPLSPQCLACCRNLSLLGLSISPAAGQVGQMQVRGKKKNPKARTQVNVKLVKDLPGYGRKGAIVPVPIGRMRNYYFPYHIADYVSMAEARNLKRNNVTIERDYEFGKEATDDGAEVRDIDAIPDYQAARTGRSSDSVRVDLKLLEPALAFAALSSTIPSFITFYRTPITTADPSKASTPSQLSPNKNSNIYGSVSTSDVATNIKALLASTDISGKVVLGDDDIHFVGNAEAQKDRVKRLGTFDIEIRIKGHEEVIKRQVRVLPEDEESAEEATPTERTDAMVADNPAAVEANEALRSVEAQVAELEAVLGDAQQKARAPTSGGATTSYVQDRGSESAPASVSDKSI